MNGKTSVGTSPTLVVAGSQCKIIVITNISQTIPIWFSFNGVSAITNGAGATPGIYLGPRERFVISDETQRGSITQYPVWAVADSGTVDVGFSITY